MPRVGNELDRLCDSLGGSGLTATYDATTNTVVLALNVDGSSVEVNADTLRVKAAGITNAMLAGGIAAAKLAITGTPTGSKFLNDGFAWAVPPGGGGSATAAALGYIDGTDATYGMVGDALTVTDGTVAGGALSTLTSASALFTAGAVGKTVTLHRTLTITDAAITSGTAALTSPGNQFPTWIVAGMPILITGAGSGGVSLQTTVSTRNSAGSITLATNALATVSGKTAGVWVTHRTTIASYSSATSVGLTAAAPYAFAGANVVWGTDNRVPMANAGAAAMAANKPLYVPPGKYLVALDATNKYGIDSTAGNLVVRCAGRTATSFYIAGSAIPTTEMTPFRGGPNLDVSDFKIYSYCLPFSTTGAQSGPAIALQARAGSAEHTLRIARVDGDQTFPMGGDFVTQSGASTGPTKVWVDDCNFYSYGVGIGHFVNSGQDGRQWIRDLYLESGYYPLGSGTDDTEYNCHCTYVHGPVGIWWENVTLKQQDKQGPGTPYHLHGYGSSTGPAPFHHFENCRTEGPFGNGILQHVEASDKTVVIGGRYEHTWSLQGGATFIRSRHACPGGNPISVQSGSGNQILLENITVDLAFDTVGSSAAIVTFAGARSFAGTIRIKDPVLIGMPTVGNSRVLIGSPSDNAANAGTVIIDGLAFDGNSTYFDAVVYLRQHYIYKFRNCKIGGTWAVGALNQDTGTVGTGELWLDRNDINTAFPVQLNAGVAAGHYIRGQGNIWRNGVPDPQANGLRGSLEPPDALNPTTVTSGASTTLDWNYRTHRVGGSATVANLYFGGTANKNCLFGGVVRLIVDAGSTWSTSAAGNIVPLTTGARTVTTVAQFVWDALAGKWYEI